MNPLLWLHYRLIGPMNTLAFVGVFALLVIGGAGLSYRMTAPNEAGQVSSIWLAIVTGGQAVFLLLLMPAAVRRAVLRDFQSGMIESHRLSPLSGFTLISGYLMGAPIQVWLLYATSLFFGTIFAAHYGYTLGITSIVPAWYFLQLCMLLLSFMITTLVLLIALGTSGKANILGFITMICVFGGWMVIAVIPGLALVLGIMSADSLYYSITKNQILKPASTLLAAGFQLMFGVIFFLAAARKVRVPERAMFSVPLGTILCLLGAGALVAGFSQLDPSNWVFREWDILPEVQVVASAGVLLLLAYVPLISAAVDASLQDRVWAFGERINDTRRRILSFMPVVMALVTLLCVIGMYESSGIVTYADGYANSGHSLRMFRLLVFITFLLSYWTDYQLLYALAVRGRKPLLAVVLSMLLLKAGPFLLDVPVFMMLEDSKSNMKFSDGFFTGISPLGTLSLLMADGGRPYMGLGVQVVLATLVTALGARSRYALALMAGAIGRA